MKAARFAQPYDQCLTQQAERGSVDQSGREQFARAGFPGRKRLLDLAACEFADLARDQARTEVAVGLQARWPDGG